jgi:tetratricopeptide (TPR) repeat protein
MRRQDALRLVPTRAAAGVLLLLCSCSHRLKGPDGQPLWYQVESQHFVLRAATDEQTAREAAAKLERVHDALLVGSWHAATEAPGKVEVLLLEDDAALRRYLPRDVAGLMAQDSLGHVLVILSASLDLAEASVLKHELAHVITNQFLLRAPLWLSEGIALYLETLKLNGDSATIGLAHPGAYHLSRRTSLDIGSLMTAGPEVYLGSELARVEFYARAWLLTHMLVNRHRTLFDLYIKRLAHAEDPQAAFTACCAELTAAALEREAKDYLDGAQYFTWTVKLPPKELSLQLRTLRPAEIRASEAQFITLAALVQPGLRQSAEREARAALEIDPGEPLAAVALCDATSGNSEACAAAARAAAQAHPDDARGPLLLSRALHHTGGPERETAIEKAIALAPEEPQALVALAELRIFQGRLKEAMEAALHAARNAPGRPQTLDAIATVRAASGDCEGAVAMEKRVLEVLPDQAPIQTASEVRTRIVELGSICAARKQSRTPPTPPRKIRCATSGPRLGTRRLPPQATVTVHFKVGRDGRPAELSSTSDAPASVVSAVLDYVRSCRYQPAKRDGEAVEVEMEEYFTLRPDRH